MLRWVLPFLFPFLFLSHSGWAETVLVMGDSLSSAYGIETKKGWVYLLNQRLSNINGKYNVINASISGETTNGGVRRIKSLLNLHEPQILILALGANDGLRANNPQYIEKNLDKIIISARENKSLVLLVGIRLPPNYGATYNNAFQAIYPRLAERHSVSLIPFLLKNIAEFDTLMQADRFHPNASAQSHILENVWPSVLQLIQTSL